MWKRRIYQHGSKFTITGRVTLVQFVQTGVLYILWLFNTSVLTERRWIWRRSGLSDVNGQVCLPERGRLCQAFSSWVCHYGMRVWTSSSVWRTQVMLVMQGTSVIGNNRIYCCCVKVLEMSPNRWQIFGALGWCYEVAVSIYTGSCSVRVS